jgi:hypothetical protein
MKHSIVVIVAVVSGCVGAAASRFVVPPARAADTPRWEYLCVNKLRSDELQGAAQTAGREGWELTTASPMGSFTNLCFKRRLP